MNWLDTHLRTFVFPNLLRYKKLLSVFGQSIGQILTLKAYGQASEDALPVFTGEIRPASGCMYEEFGKVKSMLQSLNLWEQLIREDGTNRCNYSTYSTSIKKRTLAEQFNAFNIDDITRSEYSHELMKSVYLKNYNHNQIIHTLLKNTVRSLRSRKARVVFLGRDVWSWYVVAQQIGLNSIFDPRVSREIARDRDSILRIANELKLQDEDVLFDTGFAGTIHRQVSQHTGLKLTNLMLSCHSDEVKLFPTQALSRNRALFLEYLPKYFTSGRVNGNEIHQTMTSLNEFVRATLTTIWAYKFISPNMIIADRLRNNLTLWLPGTRIHDKETC